MHNFILETIKILNAMKTLYLICVALAMSMTATSQVVTTISEDSYDMDTIWLTINCSNFTHLSGGGLEVINLSFRGATFIEYISYPDPFILPSQATDGKNWWNIGWGYDSDADLSVYNDLAYSSTNILEFEIKIIKSHNTNSTIKLNYYGNKNSSESETFDLIGNLSLPVELLFFKQKDNNLIWATASESNNDYFILEYSTTGLDYNLLTTILGAGTTNLSSNYAYSIQFEGYYRLIQVDYDGRRYEYSTIYAIFSAEENFPEEYFDILGRKTQKEKLVKNQFYFIRKKDKVKGILLIN